MSYKSLGLAYDGTSANYADISYSGPLKSFYQSNYSPSEVYVYRFQVQGLPSPLTSYTQGYDLIDAYVRSMPMGNRNQDIVGITLKPSGSGGLQVVDIVFRDGGETHANADLSVHTLQKMQGFLEAAGSQAKISDGAYAFLNPDKSQNAINFWLSKPAFWSYGRFAAANKVNLNDGYTEQKAEGRGVWGNSSVLSVHEEIRPKAPKPLYADPVTPVTPVIPAPGCQPGFTNQGGVCLPEYLEKRPAPEKEANYTPWILASVALAATAVYFAKSKESS